jgi:transposase
MFYAWLGPKKTSEIRLIVMDMWKPFRNVARDKAPQAAISCSTSSTSCAILARRSTSYARPKTPTAWQRPMIHQGPEVHTAVALRQSVPGWKAVSHTATDRQQAAQHRLSSEGGVRSARDYRRERWALHFFDNWRASLKWQRLKPYERFADMNDRHWDGTAAYCKPKNKVSLGFVEGLNNKI